MKRAAFDVLEINSNERSLEVKLFSLQAQHWIVFLSNVSKRFAVQPNLSSRYSEVSSYRGVSPAGRAPSISDRLLLNWHKYLPFTMCQLFLQCQKICMAQSKHLLLQSFHFLHHFMPRTLDLEYFIINCAFSCNFMHLLKQTPTKTFFYIAVPPFCYINFRLHYALSYFQFVPNIWNLRFLQNKRLNIYINRRSGRAIIKCLKIVFFFTLVKPLQVY